MSAPRVTGSGEVRYDLYPSPASLAKGWPLSKCAASDPGKSPLRGQLNSDFSRRNYVGCADQILKSQAHAPGHESSPQFKLPRPETRRKVRNESLSHQPDSRSGAK